MIRKRRIYHLDPNNQTLYGTLIKDNSESSETLPSNKSSYHGLMSFSRERTKQHPSLKLQRSQVLVLFFNLSLMQNYFFFWNVKDHFRSKNEIQPIHDHHTHEVCSCIGSYRQTIFFSNSGLLLYRRLSDYSFINNHT